MLTFFQRRLLIPFALVFAFASPAFADEEPTQEPAHAAEAEHHADHAAQAEHPADEAEIPAAHTAAEAEHPAEHATEGEHHAAGTTEAAAEDEVPVDPAVAKEFESAFKDIPDEVVDAERPAGQELKPSLE